MRRAQVAARLLAGWKFVADRLHVLLVQKSKPVVFFGVHRYDFLIGGLRLLSLHLDLLTDHPHNADLVRDLLLYLVHLIALRLLQ